MVGGKAGLREAGASAKVKYELWRLALRPTHFNWALEAASPLRSPLRNYLQPRCNALTGKPWSVIQLEHDRHLHRQLQERIRALRTAGEDWNKKVRFIVTRR